MTARQQKRQQQQAAETRMASARVEAGQALDTNTCPRCSQAVRRNLALTGWVQCSGLGAEGFRAQGSTPCEWQGFTA